MIVSQIKEIIDKNYGKIQIPTITTAEGSIITPTMVINTYSEIKGYIQALKDFGIINLNDYWELNDYNRKIYKNKLDIVMYKI